MPATLMWIDYSGDDSGEAARESRSSISRLWQEETAALVEQVQDSDLSGFIWPLFLVAFKN